MLWQVVVFALIAVNVMLQVGDIWTTTLALDSGATEENPVSRGVMGGLGIEVWVGIKVLLTVAIIASAYWVRKMDEDALRQITLAGAFLAVWMGFAVIGNMQILGII